MLYKTHGQVIDDLQVLRPSSDYSVSMFSSVFQKKLFFFKKIIDSKSEISITKQKGVTIEINPNLY